MNLIALLLEDEPLIAMALESTLQKEGFEVVTILSCAAANAWLESNRPAVAIVDVLLTDGDCHEVVGKLHGFGVPFIVHSGAYASEFKESVFAKGTWMGKPSASGEIVETARRMVSEMV